jgi:outer membrane protein TolC
MKLTVSFVTLLALAAGAYAQQTSNSLLPQPALQELSPTPLPGQAPPNDNPVQETASDPSDMTAEDYLAMELPPLGVLIDNSRQTAQMQYYNTAIDEAKTDLKTERRNWLKYFRATGNYQYGQMNWLSTLSGSDAADPLPVVPTYQGKEQSYWNVGGVVSIPLNDLFDRRNRVKNKKLAVEAAEQNVERWQDELSLKIIDAYTTVLQNLSMIKTQAEAVTLAIAQYKIPEADFMNGKIDAVTLSRQKNIQSATVREYEQTRASLNNALLRLEIMSHTKIITK